MNTQTLKDTNINTTFLRETIYIYKELHKSKMVYYLYRKKHLFFNIPLFFIAPLLILPVLINEKKFYALEDQAKPILFLFCIPLYLMLINSPYFYLILPILLKLIVVALIVATGLYLFTLAFSLLYFKIRFYRIISKRNNEFLKFFLKIPFSFEYLKDRSRLFTLFFYQFYKENYSSEEKHLFLLHQKTNNDHLDFYHPLICSCIINNQKYFYVNLRIDDFDNKYQDSIKYEIYTYLQDFDILQIKDPKYIRIDFLKKLKDYLDRTYRYQNLTKTLEKEKKEWKKKMIKKI